MSTNFLDVLLWDEEKEAPRTDEQKWASLNDAHKNYVLQMWEVKHGKDIPAYAEQWRQQHYYLPFNEIVVNITNRAVRDVPKLEQDVTVSAQVVQEQTKLAQQFLQLMNENPENHQMKRKDLYRSMRLNNSAWAKLSTSRHQCMVHYEKELQDLQLYQGRVTAKLIMEHKHRMAELEKVMLTKWLELTVEKDTKESAMEDLMVESTKARRALQVQLGHHRLHGGLENIGITSHYATPIEQYQGKIRLTGKQVRLVKNHIMPLFKPLAESGAECIVDGKSVPYARKLYEHYMSHPELLRTEYKVHLIRDAMLHYDLSAPPEYFDEVGYQGDVETWNFRDVLMTLAKEEQMMKKEEMLDQARRQAVEKTEETPSSSSSPPPPPPSDDTPSTADTISAST